MHVQLWQMLLIIAYGFFINYDKNGTMIGTSQPVTAGHSRTDRRIDYGRFEDRSLYWSNTSVNDSWYQ